MARSRTRAATSGADGRLSGQRLATGHRLFCCAVSEGPGELGYVDGECFTAYRWAGGHNERLPALAAELVSLPVAVIAALNGSASALARQDAIKSVLIVFRPEEMRLSWGLTNLNRPEGNPTGVSGITNFLVISNSICCANCPLARNPALLTNPASPNASRLVQLTRGGKVDRMRLVVGDREQDDELDAAFATLAERWRVVVRPTPQLNAARSSCLLRSTK